MIKWQTQFIAILTACLFLITVIYLIRKKALKEEYSLLWLTAAGVVVLASIFAGDILTVFRFVNPDSYGDILFFFIIIAQLGFILLFSVKLSAMKDQNKNLAQSIALIRRQMDLIRKSDTAKSSENSKRGHPASRGSHRATKGGARRTKKGNR
jgi:hypothetical protein